MQKRNGLPCTSWFSDKNDLELKFLKQFLNFIIRGTAVKDVRKVLDLVVVDHKLANNWKQ
jgi:TFIIF-interacting CTD phosphatase-like protein